MLDKTYDAAGIEARIARVWADANAFAAGKGARGNADPYCIVIPPPNVTGSLHMGHALNNTLQDILIRFERMRGKNVLWQPGMDHAGIATQMVVERQLATQNLTRRDLGRERFIDKVWQWKAESGGQITHQLQRLGASCDWDRERFTLDDGLSEAVREVFVKLYKEGLIYKDKRLVNWDPKFQTAISDLEVDQIEVDGHLWYFRYPLADGVTYQHPIAFDEDGKPTGYETRDYIVVATTRPETMLGDSGVAVHPEDERYAAIIGKDAILPLVGRRLRIVADSYVDPEAGTGAVKMTPAHDFNDFEVGKRTGLIAINIMAPDGTIDLRDNEAFLDGVPASAELDETLATLHGLDRFDARKAIVERMERIGLLDRVEPHRHMVPHGDRGGVPIEPYLTDQWYVDAATLAKPAIESVREGRTVFVPKNWEKTYFEWMENIQPWCISRQLWWGHRIPAWYGPDGHIFVEKDEETALDAAVEYYLALEGPWKAWVQERLENFEPEKILRRDEDVLDTWFSSALWPFSTLGWPQQTRELATYYPTSVLVTGFDIIFFWVARMMMMGLHFMGKEPFHTVYVHALVRDKHGAKMSKSKGNVIDPLELIDEYGADALRFTLAIMAAQGRDVKLDPSRVAGYRNFGTKLWNAARFAEMNGAERDPEFVPENAGLQVNRWILTELTRASKAITEAIETYRFNEAAALAYRFVWNTLCDWYVELLKPVFNGDNADERREARACITHVLDETCKLLHPFMPFITEELWARHGDPDSGLLCHAPWPRPDFSDEEAADEVNWLIELVSGIRSVRAEMNVPPAARAPLAVAGANAATRERLQRHEAAIMRLARLSAIEIVEEGPRGAVQIVVREATAFLPLGELIDLKAESARLAREAERIRADLDRVQRKLANEQFIANAKPEVVAAERDKLEALTEQAERLAAAQARIADLG